IFEYQRSRGGHAVLETTAENESHNEPAMRKLREMYHETHYDLIDHLRGSDGLTKAIYSPDIGDAICRAYVELQGAEDFAYGTAWALTTARAVNYVDVKRDEDEWR
ncbi:GIP, partial [Symbiodinium necroappetens]